MMPDQHHEVPHVMRIFMEKRVAYAVVMVLAKATSLIVT